MKAIIVTVSVALFASSVIGDYDYYCPKPEVPSYGYIASSKQDYYEVGSEVEYACNYGYKLWGKNRIRCVSKGKIEYWDGSVPECKKDGCGYLKDPDYGNVRHTGTKVGSKATYSCKRGYKLYGDPIRRCQYNGYWSGQKAQCKPVKCEYLKDPDYGKVEHGGVHVGDKATYSCDYGYELVGDRVRKCRHNGYWSDKEPVCKKSGCEYLDHPEYGKVELKGTHVGAEATYSCDYGYKLVGVHVRKCQYNGYWSDEEPICKKSGCVHLDHPPYGKVELKETHVGAKATYSCDYDYELVGDSVRTCQYNGYWSGKEPVCEKRKLGGCEYLDHPDYGKVELKGTHVGAKATYSCDYGYKLVGVRVRRCQYNGYWSDKEPVCRKINKGCVKPKDPRYGSVRIRGTYAVYSCDYGYKRVGSYYRVCRNGYWRGDAPRCVKNKQY